MLALWITALTVVTYFTQEGFWSWFMFCSSTIFIISIWQKNVLIYKIMGVFVSTLCGLYHIFIGNFFGIILESCVFAAIVVGLILYIIHLKKLKDNSGEISENPIPETPPQIIEIPPEE